MKYDRKNYFKWKTSKKVLIWWMAIMMLLLSGCGRIKQQDEVETIPLVNKTSVDYKTYLRKMWIVVDDEGDIPLSFIITDITGNMVEGYCCVGDRIFNQYSNQGGSAEEYSPNFCAEIQNGRIEFEFHEHPYKQESRNGNISLTFCEGDRIEARLTEGGRVSEYVLRPYNVSDWNLSEKSTVSEIELDSWGTVNLFYANSAPTPGSTAPHHSIPRVFLTNKQGDILYEFRAYYHSGSEVFDVVVEDMNGDKLKDVEIITGFGKQDDDPLQFEWYFFQQKDGRFKWDVSIMKSYEDGVWIKFGRSSYRKCSDTYSVETSND